MTLKEQLAILRGEPIQVYAGDPMDIPCIETSDAERLCKNPVVSVNMITYNHEPYIRQAIEGVLMQKTDFEFELVIGEDCSTDRTREICFEYQKRYPDKIRVLWCDHNLYRNPHSAGGNSARNRAHCRGEFIAFCEGDDYWTDPMKLQKQVDALRKSNAAVCFTDCEFLNETGSALSVKAPLSARFFKSYYIAGKDFFKECLRSARVHTLTAVIRKSAYLAACEQFDILSYRLSLGDYQLWIALALVGGVQWLDDVTAVHRLATTGATFRCGKGMYVDSCLINIYFGYKVFGEGTRILRLSSLKIANCRLKAGDGCESVLPCITPYVDSNALLWLRDERMLRVALKIMIAWNIAVERGPIELGRSFLRNRQHAL